MKSFVFIFAALMSSRVAVARIADPSVPFDGTAVSVKTLTQPTVAQAPSSSTRAPVAAKVPSKWELVQQTVQKWWQGENTQNASVTPPAVAPQPAKAPAQAAQPSVANTALAPVGPAPSLAPLVINAAPPSDHITPVIVTKAPGRTAPQAKELKLTKAGVPQYLPLKVQKSLKSVPKLDIGLEPQISAKDLVLHAIPPADVPVSVNALKTPPLLSHTDRAAIARKVIPLTDPKAIVTLVKGLEKPVSAEAIAKAAPKIQTETDVTLKPFELLSENDVKMLAASILYGKGRYQVALGLFASLENEKGLEQKALFYAGMCAHKLQLYTEAFSKLARIVRTENPELAPAALEELLRDLPREHQGAMADLLGTLKNKKLIPEKRQDLANYIMAKQAFKKHRLENALSLADHVATASEYYPSARYLMAISYHGLDKLPKAAQTLETLKTWIATNGVSDKNISSLTAMTLARIRMQQKQYKEALALYKTVDKEHPYWIPALVEQGWAQIYTDDAAGAIGNMYSLHSPFFNTVYKPQSYVVRTIGYINICQYGDAYRTLSVLEKDYRPWSDSVLGYLSRVQRTPEDHYQLIKQYLRGKSSDSVEGIAPQVLREVARRKDFLNEQEALNNREDEIQRYPSVDEQIRNERNKLKSRMDLAKNRQAQIRVNLEKAKLDKTLTRYIDQWKGEGRLEADIISGYKYMIQLYDDGHAGLERLRIQADHHIDLEKEQLRAQAGKMVIAHFKSVEAELSKILDNNEFLRYEVFAGSGENIRYQVAGGQVGAKAGGRVPASARPEKSLHWDFDGEYWQDEIGNYRSSLRDNCPSKGPGGSTKNGQARLGGGE